MNKGIRYMTISRPPMIGGWPLGYTALDVLVYAAPVQTAHGTAWGEIVLDRALTEREVRAYELVRIYGGNDA